MRNHKLASAAILSLAGLSLLTGAYFYDGRVGAIWTTSGPWSTSGRSVTLWSTNGHNTLRLQTRDGGPLRLRPATPQWGPFFATGEWRMPQIYVLRHTFWSIGAHTIVEAGSHDRVTTRILTAPSWPLMLPCTLAPALWLRRRRRQRITRQPGHCRTCGYDLRATPEAQGPLLPNCPECGAVRATVEAR